MSVVYFEAHALDLAEAFGRMAPEPARSPAAAFDLTLDVLGAMMADRNKGAFSTLYTAGTGVEPHPFALGCGRLIDTITDSTAAELTAGFAKVASRVPGGWTSVIIDTTAKQAETLSLLKADMQQNGIYGAEYGAIAYSIGVRYLVGLAHLLKGSEAPDDCAIAEKPEKPGALNLYATLKDGGYAARRIRGLNF